MAALSEQRRTIAQRDAEIVQLKAALKREKVDMQRRIDELEVLVPFTIEREP